MKRKGFTLVELIVVMAIISILVLFGSPKYLNHTKDAHLTRIRVNIKELETASQKYYMTYNDWPRLTDDAYTSDDLQEFSERILDITGEEVVLEEGNYYDIDYSKLANYIKPLEDKENYILRNPVGHVFYFDGLLDKGYARVDYGQVLVKNGDRKPIEGEIPIYTAEELASIGKNENYPLDGKYIQMSDIDLSGFDNWVPIGDYSKSGQSFDGYYEGNGLKISKLKLDRDTNFNGLFGMTTNGAKLTNVHLESVDIKGGQYYTGGLVGYNTGSIESSYSSGIIKGRHRVGGLVGNNIGGGIIEASYSTGKIEGVDAVGGLVGHNYEHGSAVRNSYSNAFVEGTGTGFWIGGLVGLNEFGDIINSYSTGLIKGGRYYIGGLVGRSNRLVFNAYWDRESSQQSSSDDGIGKTTEQMYQQTTYTNWDFDTIWQIEEGQSYPTLRWQNN